MSLARWALLDSDITATVILRKPLEELLLGPLEAKSENSHIAEEIEFLHPFMDRPNDLRGILGISLPR